MELRGGLRPYERDVVDQVEGQGAHVLLPPGAGTAVIGLELIRRLGGPAVVFGPSIAGQLGWQHALARFTDPAGVAALSSLDVHAHAPITLLNWDDLASTEVAARLVRECVVQAWAVELVAAGRAGDSSAARTRIARWAAHNPRKVARTLEVAQDRLIARLLHSPPPDLAQRIPAATQRLFDALVEHGVCLIVLDGCDRLTDGRALLLRHLLIGLAETRGTPPAVVALSTVPRRVPCAHRACYRLVSPPELEVASPPVVYAGDVAPHRDLVHFVEPTPDEQASLIPLKGDSRRARTAAAQLLGGCEDKAKAACTLLVYELRARPDQLRAAVLTEREGTESAPEPGSAVAVFARLLAEPDAQALEPVLLTRDGLTVASQQAARLLASCTTSLERLSLHARCVARASAIPGATLLIGTGQDWAARTAVTLAARALSAGLTRCIVGSAGGAFAEDPDAFEFDTLVDLSCRPSVTAARLRGQALRPYRAASAHAVSALGSVTPGPTKVTHIWHVVARCGGTPLGEVEVRRFVRLIEGRWGLPLEERGRRVVRGPAMFDYRLVTGRIGDIDHRALTARCLTQIDDRNATRERWAARPASDAEIVTSVSEADLGSPSRLAPLLLQLRAPLLLLLLLLGLLGLTYRVDLPDSARLVGQIAVLADATLLGVAGRDAVRIVRIARGSAQMRLAARSRAVLDALRDCGRVDRCLDADAVHVHQTEPGRLEVRLDRSSIRDARVFATALIETLAPLGGQACVLDAGAQIIPVPTALLDDPQAFLQRWRWHGSFGRLVPIGLRPPAPESGPSSALAFEVWETSARS